MGWGAKSLPALAEGQVSHFPKETRSGKRRAASAAAAAAALERWVGKEGRRYSIRGTCHRSRVLSVSLLAGSLPLGLKFR